MSTQFIKLQEKFKIGEVVSVDTKGAEFQYRYTGVCYNGDQQLCDWDCLILNKLYTPNGWVYEVIDEKLKEHSIIFNIPEMFISKKK
jgi:hypothetical protein